MSTDVEFLYLQQEDVIATGLDMAEAIQVIEEVLCLHETREVILPDKVILDLGERERGRINVMPAYVGGTFQVCGLKWIPGFPQNPTRHGLPRANALIILNSPQTGLPLAVMDGTWISAVRTGAVTGAAAKHLARSDAAIMGMIGCGVQAITQAVAVNTARPLQEIRVYDPKPEAAARAQRQIHDEIKILPRIAGSPQDAVLGADIVVTATVADEPIVKKAWLRTGVFFAHIGSYQEEEFEVVTSMDKIVVDDWQQVLHRGTPVLAKMHRQGLINDADIYGNLGEIILGRKPGRERDEENIFFQPMGMGSEDVAVAHRVYTKATEKGLGKTLRLWDRPRYV